MITPNPGENRVPPPPINEKKTEPKQGQYKPLPPGGEKYIADQFPVLNSVMNFARDLFSGELTKMDSTNGITLKAEVEKTQTNIKSVMIKLFPNLSKVLFSGEAFTKTGIPNLIEELAENPLKKLVSKGEGQFYLKDREVGLSGKAGSSSQSQKSMEHLLNFIEKDPNSLELMRNLRKSDWAKSVFENSDALNLKAAEIEAKLVDKTPEKGRELLQDLNKNIHQLSNENNNKLRFEDNQLILKERELGVTTGQSPEAKAALTVVLTRLKEGVNKAGFTREAIAIMKTLENSEWAQSVLEHSPVLRKEFDAIKSNLAAQKDRQLEVLVQMFDGVEKIQEDSKSLNEVLKLAADDNTLMPLDILALGFNSIFTIEEMLKIAKKLYDQAPNEEQKKLIVSFVLEIDRLGLNAEALKKPENEALFNEITKATTQNATAKQLLPGDDIPEKFEGILNKVRAGKDKATEEDVETCATAFTHVSVSAFTGINAVEIFKKTEKGTSVASSKIAQPFNQMSSLVIDSIISCDNLDAARRTISLFLRVAKRCVENNDLNSAKAILGAMGDSAVHRLLDTENEEDNFIIEELKALLSDDKNSIPLRNRINEHIANNDQFIPPTLKAFGDLTMAHDGNTNPITRLRLFTNPLEVFQYSRKNARRQERVNAEPFINYIETKKPKDNQGKPLNQVNLDTARYNQSLRLKGREA